METSPGRIADLRQQHGDLRCPREDLSTDPGNLDADDDGIACETYPYDDGGGGGAGGGTQARHDEETVEEWQVGMARQRVQERAEDLGDHLEPPEHPTHG
jgi:hypothetical protein